MYRSDSNGRHGEGMVRNIDWFVDWSIYIGEYLCMSPVVCDHDHFDCKYVFA